MINGQDFKTEKLYSLRLLTIQRTFVSYIPQVLLENGWNNIYSEKNNGRLFTSKKKEQDCSFKEQGLAILTRWAKQEEEKQNTTIEYFTTQDLLK